MGTAGPSPRPGRAALGRLPQAPGRSQPPASRASSLRPKGVPGLCEARLGEADPSCCCLHFVSCSAWSVVVVVVWVWGAAGQGGSPAATSARGLGPRRPYAKPPGEPYGERGGGVCLGQGSKPAGLRAGAQWMGSPGRNLRWRPGLTRARVRPTGQAGLSQARRLGGWGSGWRVGCG